MKRISRKPAKLAKPATACTYKLQEVKSPYGGIAQGIRLVAAIKNQAGRAFGDVCTSYRKPYLIQDFAIVTDSDEERAVAALRSMGYNPQLEG